jgi:hypothetical protein
MTVALYQGDGAEEVRFGYFRADLVLIALHSDGGRMSRDIQNFGEIRITILIESLWNLSQSPISCPNLWNSQHNEAACCDFS